MILDNLKEIWNRIFGDKSRVHSQRNFLNRHEKYWRKNSIYLDNIYNKIATDVSMLKFKHVRITRNPNAPDTMQWHEFSDLAQVLSASPNGLETPVVFWSNVVRKMLKDGVAVVVPRYEKGLLQEIYLADSVRDWSLTSLTLAIDDFETKVPIDSIWIFENPKQNVTAQLGQITNLIDENLNALSSKLGEQSSKLKGFLKLQTMTEDDELKKKANARVQNIMESAQNGNIGYLQKNEEFQELSNVYETASADELEFLKSQLYHAFGINEKLFTCDYSEAQYRAYYSSVLKVYQRVITEEINRKFFSKTARTQGHRLLVYYDMSDLTSLKDLSEFTFRAKYSGLMNSNELREMYFGLPAYVGGEVFESNANAVKVGIENTQEGESNT